MGMYPSFRDENGSDGKFCTRMEIWLTDGVYEAGKSACGALQLCNGFWFYNGFIGEIDYRTLGIRESCA
jgi:hypothetical protein